MPRSNRTSTEDRAQQLANKRGEPMAIVSMDNGEEFEVSIVPEWYCDMDEFHAFDGRVLAVIDPQSKGGARCN